MCYWPPVFWGYISPFVALLDAIIWRSWSLKPQRFSPLSRILPPPSMVSARLMKMGPRSPSRRKVQLVLVAMPLPTRAVTLQSIIKRYLLFTLGIQLFLHVCCLCQVSPIFLSFLQSWVCSSYCYCTVSLL